MGRGTRGGRIFGLQVDSHEKTINKGKYEISQVADRLGIRPREDITGAAHRLYKLAVQRNFTRGRRTQQVAGACLYIVCRQESRPYMLIDFSDVVQTNVYVLGAVFLQLCRLLRLEQHPLISKPIDPSLFIHRFADKLNFGRRMHAVANTALRLVASMKRDWMQTGRRPSGVCGAALWVAALLHGYERTKRDVVAVVHVGEATLRKRVTEFENTPSAQLSIDEFDARAKDYEKEQAALADNGVALLDSNCTELSCVHKSHEGVAHFAHGMCRVCYLEYARVSGGARGGEDPPSFQAAEAKRDQEAAAALPAAGQMKQLAAPPGAGEQVAAPAPALPALPAPPLMASGKRLKKLTVSETHALIAASAKKATAAKTKESDRQTPEERAAERGDAALEEEMEKALDDTSSHLGEFAVMTGLRSKRKGEATEAVVQVPAGVAGAAAQAAWVEAGLKKQEQEAQERAAEERPIGVGVEVMEAATALLVKLVGEECANSYCLPFSSNGIAKGSVGGKQLSSLHPDLKKDPKGIGGGRRVAAADQTQLHFLIAAGCFDSSAIARIKKFSKHDIDHMAATPLPLLKPGDMMPPPPPRSPKRADKREKVEDGEGDDEDSEEEEEEPDTFSDVDDDEVANYIHTEEEVRLRRVIWSELNREYLETQAAKEAAMAAAPDAEEKAKKEAKRKRKYTHTVPADSAVEATQMMLASNKKISSKINYDALNDLFSEDAGAGGAGAGTSSRSGGSGDDGGGGTGRLSSRLTGMHTFGSSLGSSLGSGRGLSGGLGRGGLGTRLAAGVGLGGGVGNTGGDAFSNWLAAQRQEEQQTVAPAAPAVAAAVPVFGGISEATLAKAAMQSTGSREKGALGGWLS